MGEPSMDYVERVSYQSDKLAILMGECLKQGTEMWNAVKNSSSFKANDYLQYGEYVLEYKADFVRRYWLWKTMMSMVRLFLSYIG